MGKTFIAVVLIGITLISLCFVPQPHLFSQEPASRDGTAVTLLPPLSRSLQRDLIVSREAQRVGIPTQIAIAVSHVEDTSGDSLALSERGAVGIMQVLPTYWLHAWEQECYGDRSLFDRQRNACVGVRVLDRYHRQYGSWMRAFCAYHGSSGDVCQKYAEAVLSSIQ